MQARARLFFCLSLEVCANRDPFARLRFLYGFPSCSFFLLGERERERERGCEDFRGCVTVIKSFLGAGRSFCGVSLFLGSFALRDLLAERFISEVASRNYSRPRC